MPQQGMVWAVAATSLACLAAALRPTTQPPPKRRNSLVRTASDVAAGAVMPAVLLGVVGAAAALSTHFAWRAKATNAFKASYATTWLTLGTATILYVQPDREELERKLRASASARESLTPVSAEAREAQIRALRGTAEPDGARR